MNLSQLYTHICKSPILTKEQEYELLDTYFNEDNTAHARMKAKNDLLASHRRFAFSRAKLLSNGDIEQFEELYNAGCEGLVVGLDKFDHTQGMRFLTYAGWWVYQRQMKSMSEFRLVSLPTQKQQLSVKIRKYKETLGRDVTIEDLVNEFPDSTEKDLKELSQTSFLTFHFDNVNEDDIPLVEGTTQVDKEMLISQMLDIINEFEGDEPELIMRLYGLTDDGKKESYSVIQEDFPKVTRQYLKELKDRALRVLQHKMAV
jgi:RNA polymerase sigma factor (sigma-70 family)